MSRKRQMIELGAPSVVRETREERFVVEGFTCPECHGNGWGWRQAVPPVGAAHFEGEAAGDGQADRRGWSREACPTCGGTGELDAEVRVRWVKQARAAERRGTRHGGWEGGAA